ncbi:MAG: NUDIX domain-containing protein [Myxococcales bacterium]|nr:NUDIX domain-containing protein [Myxococcales bacterium]
MDDPTDIAVVDDANRFVRWSDRADVHGNHLPHRSVHVLLFTPDGALVVQRRHPDKLTWPSHWDVSVAGHVEHYPAGPDERLDEVYAAVAARELEEELGVQAALRCLGAFGPEPGVHYEQLHLFHAVHPGPFRIQQKRSRRCAPSRPPSSTRWSRRRTRSATGGAGGSLVEASDEVHPDLLVHPLPRAVRALGARPRRRHLGGVHARAGRRDQEPAGRRSARAPHRETWDAFVAARLPRWMHIFEETGRRYGLTEQGGTLLGTPEPGLDQGSAPPPARAQNSLQQLRSTRR